MSTTNNTIEQEKLLRQSALVSQEGKQGKNFKRLLLYDASLLSIMVLGAYLEALRKSINTLANA